MTTLISTANAQALTDKIAALYEYFKSSVGSSADVTPTVPSARNLAQKFEDTIVALGSYEQQQDLLNVAGDPLAAYTVEKFMQNISSAVTALSSHCQKRGSSVAASINSLPTFLLYYNNGAGGARFSNMLAANFQKAWEAVNNGSKLPAMGVMCPQLSPDVDATAYPNGMGTATTAGVFTDGVAVDQTRYSEVVGTCVVITTFTGGSAPPTVTVTGVDHLGNAAQTWTGTLAGNNPASALSGTGTIVGSITGQTRATVTVTSTTGIVAGSVLVINSGLPDQETVIVEAVPSGTTFTAVFKKAHGAGATVTGKTTVRLVPTVGGRRLANVTGIVVNITGHSAGAVRIEGDQERVGI